MLAFCHWIGSSQKLNAYTDLKLGRVERFEMLKVREASFPKFSLELSGKAALPDSEVVENRNNFFWESELQYMRGTTSKITSCLNGVWITGYVNGVN